MLRSYEFGLLRTIPGDKQLQFVAVGSVGLEVLLVKEPLDPASQADLVGVPLRANWPAHLAVPASSEENDRHPSQAGGHDTEGPHPVFLFFDFHHENL